MFPHTVTLYNVVTEENQSTFEEVTTNYITVLQGVLLDATKAKTVNQSGLVGADAVSLYPERRKSNRRHHRCRKDFHRCGGFLAR